MVGLVEMERQAEVAQTLEANTLLSPETAQVRAMVGMDVVLHTYTRQENLMPCLYLHTVWGIALLGLPSFV
jgi:hypothetical protein